MSEPTKAPRTELSGTTASIIAIAVTSLICGVGSVLLNFLVFARL